VEVRPRLHRDGDVAALAARRGLAASGGMATKAQGRPDAANARRLAAATLFLRRRAAARRAGREDGGSRFATRW
jgi:hypothetical protein